MSKLLTSPLLVGAAYLLSFWPIWHWYVLRMLDGADEPWGLLAFIAVLLIASIRYRKCIQFDLIPFTLLSACIACYCLLGDMLPPLLNAIVAVTGLSICLSRVCVQRYLQPGFAMLAILSLPVIASLQFYGGYPIRLLTSHIVSLLLGMSGLFAESEGTVIRWAGELIAIDAPCAGIKMLWSGMLTNALFIAWFNYSWRTCIVASMLTSFCVFCTNVLRSYILFYRETGLYEVPLSHEGVGLVLFLVLVQVICFVHLIVLRKRTNV